MNFRAFGYLMVFFIALGWNGIHSQAVAQSSGAPIKSTRSSGLTVSISKVIVSQRKVMIQFVALNNMQSRVYLMIASGDQGQQGILGSGDILGSSRVTGLEYCSHSMASCATDPAFKDLARFSYIEPGEFTVFGITYEAGSPVNENDTISFSLAVMARIAAPGGDPSQAGPPKPIRFNFPYVPLNRH
jgi:hypothetical protein